MMDETIDCDVVGLLVRRLPHFSHMKTPEQREWWFATFWRLREMAKECAHPNGIQKEQA